MLDEEKLAGNSTNGVRAWLLSPDRRYKHHERIQHFIFVNKPDVKTVSLVLFLEIDVQ